MKEFDNCTVCHEGYEYGVNWTKYAVGLPTLHLMDEKRGLCCIDREEEVTFYHYLPTGRPQEGEGEYGDNYEQEGL